MANFLKSLFFGETDESEETKLNRNFDVLKYDGIKALKIGKNTYAIRCFNEALKLKEDVEVLEHLVGAYNREDRMEEAIETAGRLVDIEPDNIPVLLMRANLNFMAEKYEAAIADYNGELLWMQPMLRLIIWLRRLKKLLAMYWERSSLCLRRLR